MKGRGIVRRLAALPARAAESRFQRRALARHTGAVRPQLFILGLPRTGTTLVYQYIVHRCEVAYFTNRVGKRYYDPCRATWRDLSTQPPYRSDFQSRYGRSEGVMAPREAGNFWLRFFDIDAYERFADVAPGDVETLRRTVRCVQALFGGAPYVNKNVKHLLRIDALARIFPDGHFLVIDRDLSDVGLSILRARREVGGSSEAWFSARPPGHASLVGRDPVDQVCAQIAGLDARMAADLAELDAARVHRIHYDDFCARPDAVIENVPAVFAGVGWRNDPVAGFEVRRSAPRDDEETRLVERLSRGAR